MKLSLNGATTMRADLATDIRAAKEAGFDLIEIWAAKLRDYLASHTAAELKAMLARQGMQAHSINSIERITFRDESGRAALRQECEELWRIASAIDCPYVVVVPGEASEKTSREEVIEQSARTLSQMADIAEPLGVGLAFEFLGQRSCSVQTLGLASEIVDKVGRDKVGLVIDTFHFYAGGSSMESIEALDPARLFILHINDAEDRPRAQLEDRHRLLPGLGILPLRGIISALKRRGYDGVASVEIFRPEYWERDPFELARAARESAARVIESA